MVQKYRKRPVVIEAVQWTGRNLDEIRSFAPDSTSYSKDALTIYTLEGAMQASVGDFIIKGVNGEFYPCKPDIFLKTYKEVK